MENDVSSILKETVLWVGVEVYGLIVQDAHIFTTGEEADDWFTTWTEGLTPETLYDDDGNCVNEDYDQNKIFVVSRAQAISIINELLKDEEIRKRVLPHGGGMSP
jgi:hypothetical protein